MAAPCRRRQTRAAEPCFASSFRSVLIRRAELGPSCRRANTQRSLIARVAREQAVPPQVVEHILDRSEGVRLLLLELTRAALDTGGTLDGRGGELRSSMEVPR